MGGCVETPSVPLLAPSPPMRASNASTRPLRPRPHSASIPNAFHHTLLNVGQRSRTSEVPHAFHEAVLRADTAPKSIRTFKGHAKGILRQLFFALLMRFFVLLVVAVGVVGSTAWYVWSHRGDDRLNFRPSLGFHRPT